MIGDDDLLPRYLDSSRVTQFLWGSLESERFVTVVPFPGCPSENLIPGHAVSFQVQADSPKSPKILVS